MTMTDDTTGVLGQRLLHRAAPERLQALGSEFEPGTRPEDVQNSALGFAKRPRREQPARSNR